MFYFKSAGKVLNEPSAHEIWEGEKLQLHVPDTSISTERTNLHSIQSYNKHRTPENQNWNLINRGKKTAEIRYVTYRIYFAFTDFHTSYTPSKNSSRWEGHLLAHPNAKSLPQWPTELINFPLRVLLWNGIVMWTHAVGRPRCGVWRGMVLKGDARELKTRDTRENGVYISVEKAGLEA